MSSIDIWKAHFRRKKCLSDANQTLEGRVIGFDLSGTVHALTISIQFAHFLLVISPFLLVYSHFYCNRLATKASVAHLFIATSTKEVVQRDQLHSGRNISVLCRDFHCPSCFLAGHGDVDLAGLRLVSAS